MDEIGLFFLYLCRQIIECDYDQRKNYTDRQRGCVQQTVRMGDATPAGDGGDHAEPMESLNHSRLNYGLYALILLAQIALIYFICNFSLRSDV